MTRGFRWLWMAVAVWGAGTAAMAADSEHWLGGGAHYWKTVNHVDVADIDEDGVGWFATYQWRPSSPLGLELDWEVLPDTFAGAGDNVYSPQAYLLAGSTLYVAAGIGYYVAHHDLSHDPFYVLRAGLNLEILPHVALDVSGDYRFTNWDDKIMRDIDSDTVTLSVALRLGL